MKQIIKNILINGFSKTKRYTIDDITNYLYILQYIFINNPDVGMITNNDNKFWQRENNKNRIELISDISSINKSTITDGGYFRIINRFENGDRYGIEI